MTASADESWLEAWRRSRYEFLHGGRWRIFALDGSARGLPGLSETVTLVTAWNPGAVEQGLAWNRAADCRLLRSLVANRWAWSPARGRSLPGVEPAWREDGFAVFGLKTEEMGRIGAEWGQKALVFVTSGSAGLVMIEDLQEIHCGLREIVE